MVFRPQDQIFRGKPCKRGTEVILAQYAHCWNCIEGVSSILRECSEVAENFVDPGENWSVRQICNFWVNVFLSILLVARSELNVTGVMGTLLPLGWTPLSLDGLARATPLNPGAPVGPL